MRKEEMYEVVSQISKYGDFDDATMEEIKKYIDSYPYDETDWKSKFEDMKSRYTTRFYTSEEGIKEDQKTDIKNDEKSDVTTIDELFTKREGDYK